MKLLKLTLNNIGPYKGSHTIDFNELSNSLFLITGPTGAGKSYIFDSICYALYGSTTGGKRGPSDIKSKYATDFDFCSVELEFECQNKKYKIIKNPEQYSENKKNSAKTAKRDAATVLITPNGQYSKSSTDTIAKIGEIIGLTYDQFKMTMMIAQGDFYSLINASTRDREAIFRKILNTGKLRAFIDKLSTLESSKKTESKIAEQDINSCRARFSFDGELKDKVLNPNVALDILLPLIEDELKDEKASVLEHKTLVDSLDAQSKEAERVYIQAINDNKNLSDYNSEVKNNAKLLVEKDIFKQKEDKVDLAKKADKAMGAYVALSEALEQVNTIENRINEAKLKQMILEKDLASKQENKNQVPKLQERNEELTVLGNKQKETKNSLVRYRELLQKKSASEKELAALNKEYQALSDQVLDYTKEVNALKELVEAPTKDKEVAVLDARIAAIDADVKKLKDNLPMIETYIKDCASYIADIKNYEDKEKIYNSLNKEYIDYDVRYHKSIAGILAKDLVEGTPCPVCGSIHHTNKAILTEELSKVELEKYKKKANDALDIMNKAHTKMSSSSATIEQECIHIKSFFNEEFNENTIREQYTLYVKSIEETKNPLIKERTELASYMKEQETAKKSYSSYLDLIDKRKEEMNEKHNRITNCNIAISGNLAEINALGDLSGLDEKIIDEKLEELRQEYRANSNKIKEINEEYERVNTDLNTVKGSITDANTSLEQALATASKNKESYEALLVSTGLKDYETVSSYILEDYIVKQLEGDINTYKAQLFASNELLNKYKTSGYDSLCMQDIQVLEDKKNEISRQCSAANEAYTAINMKYFTNSTTYKDLTKAYANSGRIVEEYRQITTLYAVAAGQVAGTDKVNFEVYYQLQVFDEILKVASRKFNAMTNGRYEMLPGKPKGGNGQVGLEIDVRDLYNGEVRPVSGLSGGESFQASMALALAFSEIIQIKAGGIELNSMFIDEGFGTLDNEMLNNTKKILLDIGAKTNRRIGIISHIQELERSIPSKIIVNKSDKGSFFTIKNE